MKQPVDTLSREIIYVLIRSTKWVVCIYRFSGKINWSVVRMLHTYPIPIHEMKTFHCLSSQDTIAHNCRWSSLKINCRNEMVKKEVEHAIQRVCVCIYIYTHVRLLEKKKKKGILETFSDRSSSFIRKLGLIHPANWPHDIDNVPKGITPIIPSIYEDFFSFVIELRVQLSFFFFFFFTAFLHETHAKTRLHNWLCTEGWARLVSGGGLRNLSGEQKREEENEGEKKEEKRG